MTRAPRREPRTFRDLDAAVAAVRAEGLRLSSARRAVLAAVFAAPGPVTAEQIVDGLRGRAPGPDISSVYRNLERLEELGIVRHLHAGHGPGLYVREGAVARGFLACDECGAITTVEGDDLDALRAGIRAATGFEADLGHFPLAGRCAACARATGAAPGG